MSTVSTIQNVNTLNRPQTASATNANTAPRQRRTNNRIRSTLIQRDCGHNDGRKNSYELDKLCDALNLSGHVVIEGNFAVMLGGSANVWKGTYNGQCVAVKVIRDYARSASVETLKRRLVREVRAWSKLFHRNVLPLLGFIYGAGTSDLASLVSPWMALGTATLYLRDRDQPVKIRVVTGVADGLCYLHRHDVIHGDLKGDNILIDDTGEPRLSDFGLSKLISEVISDASITGEVNQSIMTETASLMGSLRWMAREMFSSPDQTVGVTMETDVWAFGMTLLELFSSKIPFHELMNDAYVIVAVHAGKLPTRPSRQCGIDDELWDLCCRCWHENPKLRPTTREIAKFLWDVDLRCKLRSREKRRHSREDENDTCNSVDPSASQTSLVSEASSSSSAASVPSSSSSSQADRDNRVHKSPKLGTLADLDRSTVSVMSSPSTPMNVARSLVHAPVPRTRTRSYGGNHNHTFGGELVRSRTSSVSSMPSSAGGSLSSPASAQSSPSGVRSPTDIDPRRLFSAGSSPAGEHMMAPFHTMISRTHSESALYPPGSGEAAAGLYGSAYGYGTVQGHGREDLHMSIHSAPAVAHYEGGYSSDGGNIVGSHLGGGALVHRHAIHSVRHPSSLRHATVPQVSLSPATSTQVSPIHTPPAPRAHFELSPATGTPTNPHHSLPSIYPTSPMDYYEFRHPSQWVSSTYPYNYVQAHGGEMTPSYPAFFMDLHRDGVLSPTAATATYTDFLTFPEPEGNGNALDLGLGLTSNMGERTVMMGGVETPIFSTGSSPMTGGCATITEFFTDEPVVMHEHFPEFAPQQRYRQGVGANVNMSASFTTPRVASPTFSDCTPMLPSLDDEDPRLARHDSLNGPGADDTPVIRDFDDFGDDILGGNGEGNSLLDGMALFGGHDVEDGADEFRFKSPSPAPQAQSSRLLRDGAKEHASGSNGPLPFAYPIHSAPRSPEAIRYSSASASASRSSRETSRNTSWDDAVIGGHGAVNTTTQPQHQHHHIQPQLLHPQPQVQQMPTPELSPLLSQF